MADSSKMDIAGLNPFRYRCYSYDEQTAFYYLKSKYYDPWVGRFINAYKGKLVLQTNLSRSGSFGILFIIRNTEKYKVFPDDVRHEYGHTKQLDQLSVMKYTFCIVIPSLFSWGDYYSKL